MLQLIHKVRAGQRVEEAVEEIIDRGVSELRKKAFGDDEEDSKRLPWTREQAWKIIKLLSKQSEVSQYHMQMCPPDWPSFQVSYYDVLLDVPFKGEESALREMEHYEIVSTGTLNGTFTTRLFFELPSQLMLGRPSVIKPGKPVLRWVFERLASGWVDCHKPIAHSHVISPDPIFAATQEISYNSNLISNYEKTIRGCEDELISIKPIATEKSFGWILPRYGGLQARARYLTLKIQSTQKKIEALEKTNTDLRVILCRGDSSR